MKKNVLKSIVLLGGILFLSASCVKEIESNNDTYRPAGSPIVFSAATGYDNGIATRTAYSGETVTLSGYSLPFERIDWVSGDKIKVCYLNSGAAAVYTVGTPTADGEKSSASISSQNSMIWDEGNDDHVFFAMYPDASSDSGHGANTSASLQVSPNGAIVNGLIPAAQTVFQKGTGSKVYDADMAYGYLVSKKTIEANSTATSVDLPFRPATTTFQFQFKTSAGSASVSSFEMTSTTSNLAGNFSFDMKEGADADDRTHPSWGDVTVTNATKTITVTFDQPATITTDVALDFTVFALPIDITNVTLKFNFTDNTSKSLALKRNDAFDTFLAGKKYIITNGTVPGEDWVYTLEETIVGAGMHRKTYRAGAETKGINTYKTHIGNGGGYTNGQQVIVPVKFRYSPADAEGNNLEQWSEDLPLWLTSLTCDLQTAVTPNDTTKLTGNYIVMPQLDSITINQIDSNIVDLKKKGSLGSSGTPHDLTLYDIDNLATPRSRGYGVKTANTYVVDRPGYYMFPLVYGNAIDCDMGDNNGWNTLAYTDGVSGWEPPVTSNVWGSEGFFLHTFRNYLNQDITSPYILDNIGFDPTQDINDVYEAVIVWEDCIEQTYLHFKTAYPNYFLSDAAIVANPNTSATYKAADGSTKTVPYIKFYVSPGNIREGNAEIALREKTGDKRIIWSWQIWVSNDPLQTTTLASRSTTVPTNDMLKVPVGYLDDMVEWKYYYEPRIYYVEVSHDDSYSDATPLVFQVTQKDDPYYIRSVNTMSYYQYGRKDPFPGWTETSVKYGDDGIWWSMSGSAPTGRYPRGLHSPSGYEVFSTEPYYGSIPAISFTAVGDVSYGIQHPYNSVLWDDGYAYGWTYSKGRNLWNMAETEAIATVYNDFVFHPELDRTVIKTVYDPCPPGFCVPNYAAFTILSDTGSGGSSFAYVTDAEPDMFRGIVLYSNDAHTETICIPSTGFRAGGERINYGPYAGANQGLMIGQYRFQFMYFTCKSNGQPNVVLCSNGQYGPGGPLSAGNRCDGYAILPVKEILDNAGRQSVVIGGQGTDGYYNPGDLNNNWQ